MHVYTIYVYIYIIYIFFFPLEQYLSSCRKQLLTILVFLLLDASGEDLEGVFAPIAVFIQ